MQDFIKQCLDVTRWTKSTITVIHIVIVCCALSVPVFIWNNGYVHGKKVMAIQKDVEFKKWIVEHPQQIISGSTVNNNVSDSGKHFQFGVYPLRFGWCQ